VLTVAGPLREETKREEDDKPVAITGSPDEFHPAVVFKLPLQFQSVADLVHLKLDYLIV